MMDEEWKLNVQAYLDGELGPADARRVEELLAKDAEARTLLNELKGVGPWLARFEQDVKLPGSREFYWSTIQRAIEGQAQPAARPHRRAWLAAWRTLLLPGTALAALALVLAVVKMELRPRAPVASAQATPPAESTLADAGAMTYEDYNARATLVWLTYPAEKEFAANR
jgi:anti-sigma factor RsiW